MARAAQPALSAHEITFELERFELEGGRLELSGRWFGVRGRRFVRPTLTPLGGREMSRVLADLEHKPWPAEDGAQWEAAFPWDPHGVSAKFELSVAPDITIQLPAPGGKLGRPRRLTALPRHPSLDAAWRPPPRLEPDEPRETETIGEVVPPVSPELEASRAELEAARAELGVSRTELEASRADLEAARHQLEAMVAELEETRRQLADRDSELEATRAQLGAAAASGEALDQAVRERDEAVRERDEALGERDLALRERDELSRQRDEAARQRDEALTAHGAALVMRRATRAGPHYERNSSWWRAALAVVALIVVVFAVLIVAHVL